ncbi:AraC family transcriptional regulator [Sphingopyxis sp. QXT-31]|uniref:AraC family transcriptional regulator n=1 Tax=Sphingopyxis sp. QXT-31 TaxID=1357916 RepID=UPI00097961D6|nr:AraC family transcriptional regulator [Sphingopyxis sp. QXT-31]AQA00976.1 AraC family transcriptional regulator [Sphingopyxis sp. QXT-31]
MTSLQEMRDILLRHRPSDGIHPCPLPRISLVRSSEAGEPMPVVYEPSLCLAISGRKRVLIGDTGFVYDSAQYLVVSVDLPVTGMVLKASAENPYLCLKLDLDVAVLSELLLAHDDRVPRGDHAASIAVGQVDPAMRDTALRLLRLLDTPGDIPALAPLIERELLYRLLSGPRGAMLRHIATADTRLHQISRAVAWIKDHYSGAFSIDHLAGLAGMSPSSFHEHFKSVTRFSPLQYRTRLRLLEARRLMVSEAIDAASAGFQVGYDSPSQFSRDYAKAFGMPPLRDAARLRAMPAGLPG